MPVVVVPRHQLMYQTFVFLSRSSHLLRLPPIPLRFLAVPSVLQGLILLTLLAEAVRPTVGVRAVLGLIALEGLCGGSAYVNAFYWVGREPSSTRAPPELATAREDEARRDERRARGEVGNVRAVQEKEWRMGVVGAADSWGIVCASMVSPSLLPPPLIPPRREAKAG